MEAIAKAKYLKGSPQKARLVIDLIRGRNVSQALAILKFTNKRAAKPIAKCLNSAIANATFLAEKQNIAIDPDDLWVKTCFVDMGPHKNRRRVRPAPQGRAYREQRHYCHITIEVSSEGKPQEKEHAPKLKEAAEKPATDKKKDVKVGVRAEKIKKADALKEDKKAEAETIETETVETTETVEAIAEETTSSKTTETSKSVKEAAEEADEMAVDVKDATSQRPEERHDTKPADEEMLDTNEQLERQ